MPPKARQRQRMAKSNWMSCSNQFSLLRFLIFDKFIATPNWLVYYILPILCFVIVIVVVVAATAVAAAADHTGLACLPLYTYTHSHSLIQIMQWFCLLIWILNCVYAYYGEISPLYSHFRLTSLATLIIRHVFTQSWWDLKRIEQKKRAENRNLTFNELYPYKTKRSE